MHQENVLFVSSNGLFSRLKARARIKNSKAYSGNLVESWAHGHHLHSQAEGISTGKGVDNGRRRPAVDRVDMDGPRSLGMNGGPGERGV